MNSNTPTWITPNTDNAMWIHVEWIHGKFDGYYGTKMIVRREKQ